jgi:hypothetical protein
MTSGIIRKVIFTGPSIRAKYDQALQKLNLGLACHVAGGSLMLLSSSFMGASPLPAAVFGGLLWMQVMSTAKMTELGAWVNLCKNVTQIERVIPETDQDGPPAELKEKERFILTTDGSRISIEAETRSAALDIEDALPSFKSLKQLGIIHLDESALIDSDPLCQQLFLRDDFVATVNETSSHIFPAPPGASNATIPKLAEIYQKRQKAIHGENKRLAALVANAPPVDPARMVERLGTASLAMGGAVFLLGAGMYLASTSEVVQKRSVSRDIRTDEGNLYK